MGGTSSKNSVDVIIRSGIEVINETTQECSQKARATQSLRIVNSHNVDLSNIQWDQFVTVNQNCMTSSAVSSELSQDVSVAMQQATESILKGFATLSPNKAENVMGLVVELSQQVTNAFAQVCAMEITSEQSIDIIDSSGVQLHYLNMHQVVQGVSECVQSALSDTLAQQRLQIELDQIAKAQTTGLIASLAPALIVMAIVALLFVMAPLLGAGAVITKVFTNKAFIIGAVVITLVLMYFYFKDKREQKDKDKEDEDQKDGKDEDQQQSP